MPKSPIPAHNQNYDGRSIACDGPRYYGSHLSNNIAVTPEGFRICRNAVIGRSGFQDYKVSELTDPDGLCRDFQPTDTVQVWRDPAEVFSAATLASFEGKDFSLLHPPKLITPDTHTRHSVGHITNVRKGDEPLDDGNWPMLADIIVKTSDAISALDTGSRELSCGYAYKLKRDGTLFQQTDIIGNHVALVPKGRAGSEARINDAAPKRGTRMKITLKDILTKGLKAFASDAATTPEELNEAVEAIASSGEPSTATDAASTVVTGKGKLVQIGQTSDGVKIFKEVAADANPSDPNPAMDQRAKDRKSMHDALDMKMDAMEKEENEKNENKDAAMDKLTKMFGKGDAADAAHDPDNDDCKCKDCMAEGGDGEMIEPGKDATTGEPVLAANEVQQSQLDGALTFADALKPFIAKSKDPRVKKAFDTAVQRVNTVRGDKSGGSYRGFRAAAQSISVDAKGSIQESAQQKAARETNDLFKKEMESRSNAYKSKR